MELKLVAAGRSRGGGGGSGQPSFAVRGGSRRSMHGILSRAPVWTGLLVPLKLRRRLRYVARRDMAWHCPHITRECGLAAQRERHVRDDRIDMLIAA